MMARGGRGQPVLELVAPCGDRPRSGVARRDWSLGLDGPYMVDVRTDRVFLRSRGSPRALCAKVATDFRAVAFQFKGSSEQRAWIPQGFTAYSRNYSSQVTYSPWRNIFDGSPF